MATYDDLLNKVDKKRQDFANANQMIAAQDAQRVHSRYSKDKKEGIAVQSAEVARILKGESDIDGLLKRFASASGLSRKEINAMAVKYTNDTAAGMSQMNPKQGDTSLDLLIGINLYGGTELKRVGYNVVDLLDNVYTQMKKKHRIPALPTFGNLQGEGNDNYVKKNDNTVDSNGAVYDASTSRLLTSSNVKDIRDFAKKALLPYVTAFFRAFELSDEMIHAAIDAKTDTNVKQGTGLTAEVVPVDTRSRMVYALTTEGVGEALALASMGSDPIKRIMPMIDFAFASSRGGASQEGGKKKRSSKKRSSSKKHGGAKKRSSKKRSSGRKMRGGEQAEQVMEGGKKKRSSGRKMRGGENQEVQPMEGGKKKRSSKKRSSSKKHGGAKKKSSKKRSSSKRYGGAKKKSSKKRSSGKRRGGAWGQDGGKKKRSSKKRSSARKH